MSKCPDLNLREGHPTVHQQPGHLLATGCLRSHSTGCPHPPPSSPRHMLPGPSSVQLLSCVQLFVTPWTAACQTSLSITNPQSLLTLMSIQLVMPSKHLILCHPLLLLPSIFPSIKVFSRESALPIRWPKYWSFSISPSNEHSGLISFRINWLDLLAVQGTLKSFLQHHSSKTSVLRCSAFFVVQLSYLYMPGPRASCKSSVA